MAGHTATSPEDGSGAALADILSMAVELNRNGAMRRNVRVHCYVLDQALKSEDQHVLLDKLDRLLGRAIQNALWGSLITCQAGIRNGEAQFFIRFAVPASDEKASSSGIEWIDELWCWSPGQAPADEGRRFALRKRGPSQPRR